MEENLYEELLIELECPICTNYMSPPILQCATGHSICEPCRKKLPKCAICQGHFTNCRNRSLEGLSVKMRYPCINRPAGCTAKLTYTERNTHELRCPLKGFKCAMEKCTWVGKLEDLAAHWASKKMSSKPYHENNVCHTKMKAESYYVNMVNAHNRMFWFKCKSVKNKLFWAVQYIGNGAEADNFYYEIEIIKPGKSKKRILMSDYCQSIELQNSQLFNDDACISINTDAVSGFVSGDQLLIYYLRVNVGNEPSQAQALDAVNKTDSGTKQRDRSKGPPNHIRKKNNQQNQQQKQNQPNHGWALL